MIKLDDTRARKLVQLAREQFDYDLLDAEVKALNDSASSIDLPPPADGADRPLIRPEFVRWLATDPACVAQIDPKGIGVYGFTLSGDLDLRECRVRVPLHLVGCTIQGKISLLFAETLTVFLRNSQVAGGIEADGVSVHGPLSLRQTTFSGKVSLQNARIRGDLDCKGVQITVQQIPATPDPITGKKKPETPVGLSADGAEIKGDLLLSEGFKSNGTIGLLGTHIKNDLICKRATIALVPVAPASDEEEPDPPTAINADNVQVDGNVELNEGFEAVGEVRLVVAQIKGQLNCEGAKLLPPALRDRSGKEKTEDPDALSADGARIGDSAIFSSGLKATGTIRLPGAEIGGQLRFIDAEVTVVICSNVKLERDFLWRNIVNPSKAKLDLTGATIRRLRDDRTSWPEPPKLKKASKPAPSNQASKPKELGRLKLNGLVYQELTLEDSENDAQAFKRGPKVSVWNPRYRFRDRIDWLNRQSHEPLVEPQPWMQLSKYLEAKGDSVGAKHVLFTLRCLQAAEKGALARAWAVVFAWFEEVPLRILFTIVVTLLLGTIVFIGTSGSGAMIPATKDRFDPKARIAMAHYPHFQPFVYTLENALPLVKLGMDDKWMPDPGPEFCRPWFPRWSWLYFLSTYGILVFTRWALILSGWLQATILAAAIANRFKQ